MPTSSAPVTSSRLLSLLSLLQVRRDWPGDVLAERLDVSSRTVRRDVDRLRELGYPILAVKGPAGGYRLDAGTHLPPMLFDDDQAVALAVALRGAALIGAGVEEPAARALATLRQLMPHRLRVRLDALELSIVDQPRLPADAPVDTGVLLAVDAAIRGHHELRFDYRAGSSSAPADGATPTRQVQPHHLVARGGRWYLLAWVPGPQPWRTYRVDRIAPRVPAGPRFTPRTVPGGDPAAFLAARLKGSDGPDRWPCHAEVILDLPAPQVVPFALDGVVDPLGPDRCRLRIGSWSWAGLAATLARFDADLEVVDPPELRTAFAELARRAAHASEPSRPATDDPVE